MRCALFASALIAVGGPLSAAAQGGAPSGAAPSPALLVLSKAERVLSVVDPATRAVVARVPSGPDPHEVVASADGRVAYVSNYGGGAYHTITPVDLVRREALPAVDLGPLAGPHGLAFVGGKVWFTAEAARVVGRYDPAARRVDWVLGTGQEGTHMVEVSADTQRVVTTNVRAGTVTVAEAARGGPPPAGAPARWATTVVPVGPGAEGFDVSPDGRTAWIANAGDGTISVVDLAAKRVERTLDAGVRGANRLKFTPDGALVFVSTLGGPDVTVLRAATGAVVKRVPVGRGAAGLLVQPDGARVYVACTPDDYVAVIDVASLAVAGRITAGRQPDGLAWAVRR